MIAVETNPPVRLTAAVRAADSRFESVGGSSRHYYVNDCLIPALEAARLVVVDVLVPRHLRSAERDIAALARKLDRAEGRERFAMEIFDDLRDYLDGIRLPSSLETRIIARLDALASKEGGAA